MLLGDNVSDMRNARTWGHPDKRILFRTKDHL